MQTTSALYKSIVSSENHWFETRISINGNIMSETQIMSVARTAPGMNSEKPSVGGALSAQLSVKILEPSFSIPRMAAINVFVRACDATRQSEWIPNGQYFIDTRAHNETVGSLGTMQITAYDAMMKFEQDYPSTTHDWPYRDTLVIAEMASAVGISVDARVNQLLTSGYMLGLPVGYTMRETLGHIAAAYGGNFIISNEGKLLFVPLYGFDPDISGNYLADESGNALVFGNEGWCILV